MNISIDLAAAGERRLTEAELAVAFEKEAPELAAHEDLYGWLVLQYPGTEDLSIQDQLSPLVSGLCLRAPAELKAKGEAEVSLWTQPSLLKIKVDGEFVDVSKNGTEQRRYPRAEFLAALRACARRYTELLKRLPGEAPQRTARVQAMENALASTT